MKRIFILDTENIGNKALPGAENLTKEDTVILFHNEGCNIYKLVSSLAETPASTEIKEMSVHQKNAMDFQICTYLGSLITVYGTKAEYCIVSKDKGYFSAIEFIKSNLGKNIKISQSRQIESAMPETKEDYIDEMLGAYPRKVRKFAREGLIKTATLLDYHNFLQTNLPKDGQSIYRFIKPVYQQLRLSAC